MCTRLVVALLVVVCIHPCIADTIELWNGKIAEDVTVLGVKEGILEYKRQGQLGKVKLTSVKNIIRISDAYKISYFADYELKRVKGKILTVKINDPRPRISQPVIRVYCCLKNTKGAYDLYLYQNCRHDDVTRVYGLPLVDTDSYKSQHYFISRTGMAYRIEIWQDGEMRALHEELPKDEELPKNWHRTLRLKATRTFKELDTADIAEVEKDQKEKTEAPPATCTIRTVSLKPSPGNKDTVCVTVYYSLVSPGKDRIVIPEVNFHYVAEDKDGNRKVAVLKVDSKSGRETTLASGRTNRTVSADLPSEIQLSLLDAARDKGVKRVIYWIVVAKYGDKVVHTKERSNPTVKSTLPEGWWKE